MSRALGQTNFGPAWASALALTFLVAGLDACTADRGPESASRQARHFYSTLNSGDFDRAASMLARNAGRGRLLDRFGSIGAWADRLTKNRIIAQLHATESSTEGEITHVEILVIFHDGTRRRDALRLIHSPSGWIVDAASVPGNNTTHGS
jgi:hypothetical protein